MDKVFLNQAIREQKIYYLDNKDDKSFSQMYYYSINGEIRFISLRKIELEEIKEGTCLSKEYSENTILELEIEYKNLNHFDTDSNIFSNNTCYLVDTEGYHFDLFYTIKESYINYFVTKIKQRQKMLFLVPNEENDYYFKISKSNFIEME